MLKGKIALITGASNGLGLAVAKKYIDNHVHVIAIGRNASRLEALDDYARDKGSFVTIVKLDLTDYPKIAELGQRIAEKFGKLDIMVACAAILGELSPLDHYNFKIWEKVIATNLTANWHLIKTMTPLLQKSSHDTSYALFATCKESIANAYWGAYSVSKAGLENLVKIYEAENSKTKLSVKMIDPGVMGTKIRKEAMPGFEMSHWPDPERSAQLFLDSVTGS